MLEYVKHYLFLAQGQNFRARIIFLFIALERICEMTTMKRSTSSIKQGFPSGTTVNPINIISTRFISHYYLCLSIHYTALDSIVS